jgi:hypothetical protein
VKYAYIVLGELEVMRVVSALVAHSKWFIFTPLPNGKYEIQAKCEAGLPPVRKSMGWTARDYIQREHTDECGRTPAGNKCWCHKLPKGVKL